MKQHKPISLEDIEKTLKEFYFNRLNNSDVNSNVKPDIEIYENENTFIATINSPNLKVNTGKGGLKLFLNNPLPLLKVKYNGKVLSEQETINFYAEYR